MGKTAVREGMDRLKKTVKKDDDSREDRQQETSIVKDEKQQYHEDCSTTSVPVVVLVRCDQVKEEDRTNDESSSSATLPTSSTHDNNDEETEVSDTTDADEQTHHEKKKHKKTVVKKSKVSSISSSTSKACSLKRPKDSAIAKKKMMKKTMVKKQDKKESCKDDKKTVKQTFKDDKMDKKKSKMTKKKKKVMAVEGLQEEGAETAPQSTHADERCCERCKDCGCGVKNKKIKRDKKMKKTILTEESKAAVKSVLKLDYEEDVVDGFAIYSFFTYDDCLRVSTFRFPSLFAGNLFSLLYWQGITRKADAISTFQSFVLSREHLHSFNAFLFSFVASCVPTFLFTQHRERKKESTCRLQYQLMSSRLERQNSSSPSLLKRSLSLRESLAFRIFV